jgi:pyruvate/2-oxoacid:ferredoxin oxidoreductase alpha subunit
MLCDAVQVGKGIVRRSGKDVCLLAYGSSVNEALAASELLQRSGVSATVVDARFCKPLDTDLIRRCAREHAAMISIEEGSIGGFAAHVMQVRCRSISWWCWFPRAACSSQHPLLSHLLSSVRGAVASAVFASKCCCALVGVLLG